MQHELDALNLSLGAFDGSIGLVALGDRRLNAGLGPFVVASPLVESLLGNNLFSDQFLAAFEI